MKIEVVSLLGISYGSAVGSSVVCDVEIGIDKEFGSATAVLWVTVVISQEWFNPLVEVWFAQGATT